MEDVRSRIAADHPVQGIIDAAIAAGEAEGTYQVNGQEFTTRVVVTEQMKAYDYKTDASSGTIEASSAEDALRQVMAEEGITEATMADGAWAWVEAADGSEERLTAEAG